MATPTHLLERMVEQRIELRLKDGRTMTGRLLGLDEHMNLALDEVEERSSELTRRLGRVVLRGSNVISLNVPSGSAPGKSG